MASPTKKLHVQLITPERLVFETDVDEALVPTKMGEIGVLPHHAPLLSLLKAGMIVLRTGKQEQLVAVSSGSIEVRDNVMTILADTAERAEEINVDRAQEARQKAETLMKEKNVQDVDYTFLAAKIEKELARLKVARKHRRQV